MSNFKLTKRTKAIVENFSRINPQMLFRAGQVVRTVSKEKDMFGIAKVEENFPAKFGINDLTKFLNVINLYDDPVLTIKDEKTVTISGNNNRKFAYTLTPEKIILTLPEKEVPFKDIIAEFKLTGSDLISIKKNISVGGLTEVVFVADGKNLWVKGTSTADPTSHEYSAKLGESDAHFNLVFVDRKLNSMMEYDYTVSVSPKTKDHGAMVKFEAEFGVVYYLAPELGSTYE